jgi:hypothetical protein
MFGRSETFRKASRQRCYAPLANSISEGRPPSTALLLYRRATVNSSRQSCSSRAASWLVTRMSWNLVPNSEEGDQARSKRSRFMTLSHAITKSRTNFSFESSHA